MQYILLCFINCRMYAWNNFVPVVNTEYTAVAFSPHVCHLTSDCVFYGSTGQKNSKKYYVKC